MIDKNIRNIIFDFGGVILNINPLLTYNNFSRLGLSGLYDRVGGTNSDKTPNLFEKGLISSGEFRKKIRSKIDHPVEDFEIDDAWNAMLLDIPYERITLLNKLKSKYKTFLLSNTNEIHYAEYTRQLRQSYGLNNLSELFFKTYFSFKLHMSKPDKEIYRYIINENLLNPEETLFIDDSIINIEGAGSVGLKTHHLKAGESINYLFSFV